MEQQDENALLLYRAEPISHPSSIVLHEDKQFYPSASEVYGEETETLVEDEDTQPIEQPIIQPVKDIKWDFVESHIPETTYKKE